MRNRFPCRCGHLKTKHRVVHKLNPYAYCDACYTENYFRPPLRRTENWAHEFVADNLKYLESLI